MSNLKRIRGANIAEQIKSADGLIDALDRRLQSRTPDEKLATEVLAIKQTLNTLLDYLGLAIEAGPKKVIKRVRLIDETNSNNTL